MKNKRKYDREFKPNAVSLYREGSKGLKKVAEDLGIPMKTPVHAQILRTRLEKTGKKKSKRD